MKFSTILLLGVASASEFNKYFVGDESLLEFKDDMLSGVDLPDVEYVQEKYGDITVTIEKREQGDTDFVPERYSQASDDHLMNTLISKGYAFSKEQGANLKIKVDCGCNCNCCFGQRKSDLWELSKDCGCDCGCCNNN
mmetsp:Transcript_24492/g.37979  ORF Transcript_24492/g.37979 Transcript_24492/m.37979 type:complete len:138 (+) Transcript_24492:1-414(+)